MAASETSVFPESPASPATTTRGLLRLVRLRQLDIGPAQIAVDAASGIDQDPDSLPAIVLAAVGLAVAGDHGLGEVARLEIALAGALRNDGKHFVRQRFNGYGRNGHLRECSFYLAAGWLLQM